MRTVLAIGCFDLLHAGHVRHLMAARTLGDLLVVLLTRDEVVTAEKGAGRPVLPVHERAALLRQLRCVDDVVVNDWPTAADAVRSLRPDVLAKGREYRGRMTPALEAERIAVEEHGGWLVFVGGDLMHTTDLIAGHTTMEVLGCR